MELIEDLIMDYAYTIYNSQTMPYFLVLHESHETSGSYIISATMKAYVLALFLQISADEVVDFSCICCNFVQCTEIWDQQIGACSGPCFIYMVLFPSWRWDLQPCKI